MTFDQVPHNTIVRVNDVQYKAFGSGNANRGQLSTQLEHDFEFDPVILAPFLIVGYPTYSEYKEGATDLFKPSTLNGGYKYERFYEFSNGANFSSNHNILFSEDHGLQGIFATRNFPEEAFKGPWEIEDLLETFIPHGPGVIKSVMAVEWRGEGSKRLQAVIKSQYLLNHNLELPGLHWRHVTFDAQNVTKTTYVQSEKITVINRLDFGPPLNMLTEAIEPVPVKASKLQAFEKIKPKEVDEELVGSNGHTNGPTNGRTNGHTNGHNNEHTNGFH